MEILSNWLADIRKGQELERARRRNQELIQKANQTLMALFESGEETKNSPVLRRIVEDTHRGIVKDKGIKTVTIGRQPMRMSFFVTKYHNTFYLDDKRKGAKMVFTLDNWSTDLSTLAVRLKERSCSSVDPITIFAIAQTLHDLSSSPNTDVDLLELLLPTPGPAND